MNANRWLLIGAVSAFLTVSIGAFGAHLLKELLEDNGRRALYETAVLYHMFHTLPLLFLGLSRKPVASRFADYAGYSFITGILLFSGSLYLLAITNQSIFGIITPVGGISFLCGWVMIMIYAIKR